ncbi:hypothetical protein FZW96_12970 [Bacillus sp. BGMRC 2118]|nr:hypothetical protein FZW96_12970 [Bacillus sp. BGMRC 2118]
MDAIDGVKGVIKNENRPTVTVLSVFGGRMERNINGHYYVEIEQEVLDHVSTELRNHININD